MPITNPPCLGIQVGELHTIPQFPLGQFQDVDNTRYQYVKATGTRAQYDVCVIDKDYNLGAGIETTLDNAPQKIGVPQIAGFSTATPFGWVAIRGALTVNVLANCAAETELYTTPTAGKLDDDATGTAIVTGIKLTVANGAGTNPVAAFCFSDMLIAGS